MKLNKKGFTLIELLAVIAVIGLVLGLSTYGIIKAVDSSKKQAENISIQSIEKTAGTYAEETAWIADPDPNEKEEYFCATIEMLINKGFLEEKKVMSDNYTFSKDNFILIIRDKQTKVIKSKELILDPKKENDKAKKCAGKFEYDIIYNTDGGTISETYPSKYTYGVGATLPTNVTKTGHTFAGWYTKSDFSGNKVTKVSDKDYGKKTYYAKWTANEYTITYNTNGGTISGTYSSKYTYGVGTTLPTNVTKTGHTFAGWYTKSDFSGSKVTSISATTTENKTYYAKWTANEYTITYNLNEGKISGTYPTKYTYGVGATLPTSITKTGYTFDGWYTKSDFSGSKVTSISTTTTGNKTYYAKWKANTYTISYDANGGSGAPASQTKTYGVSLTLSSTKPTKTGYSFQGWSTSSTATSATYSAGGSYTANSEVKLYAVWKINTYTISYNANGGSGAPSSQTKTYGVSLTLSSTKPTRTNYTFNGWNTNSSGTGTNYSAGGSYTANSGTTLYAKWTANTFTCKKAYDKCVSGYETCPSSWCSTSKCKKSTGAASTNYSYAFGSSSSTTVSACSSNTFTCNSSNYGKTYASCSGSKYTCRKSATNCYTYATSSSCKSAGCYWGTQPLNGSYCYASSSRDQYRCANGSLSGSYCYMYGVSSCPSGWSSYATTSYTRTTKTCNRSVSSYSCPNGGSKASGSDYCWVYLDNYNGCSSGTASGGYCYLYNQTSCSSGWSKA